MRLSRTTLVHLVGQVVVSAAGFAATFAIAALEGSAALGRYAVAVSLGGFLLLVPVQAVSEAVKKRISEGEDRDAYFGVGLIANGVLSATIAVALVGLGVALRTVETPSIEIVRVLSTFDVEIAALVVASAGFRTARGGLEGTKRVGTSGLLEAFDRVARTSLQVGAILAGYGVAALLGGHALALVASSAIGVWILGIRGRVPSRDHLRSVLSYAKYAWLGTLRTRLFGWFDTFVLSFFVSASLVGIYEAAWGMAALLGIVSLAIRRTLFPEVSDLSTRDDYGRIRSILEDGLAFSGVFAIPGLFGALVVGERVLSFYRPSFGKGAGILVILVCAYTAEAYGSQFVSVLNAIDRPSLAYRVNAAFVVVSVTLTVALAWAFGWVGAAVATASASAFRGLFGYRMLHHEVDTVSVPVGEIGRQVVAAALMAALVFPVGRALPDGRAWTLVVVGTGALVYLGLLFALSGTVREKALALVPVGGG